MVFSCGGQLQGGNNFGGTISEICNNLADDDGDGLIDCLDTLDCRPNTPGVITVSNAIVCAGDIGETYSITPVTGATTYTWSVPIGATITSGQGAVSIAVDWTTTAGGDVCVTAGNGFCTSLPSCFSTTIRNVPTPPASINH